MISDALFVLVIGTLLLGVFYWACKQLPAEGWQFLASVLMMKDANGRWLVFTQGWRIFSETLRADYRGTGRISAYQVMGLLAVFFAAALSYFVPADANVAAELSAGIETAWQPVVLLSLQALWVVVFVMFGKSTVTSAEISFHLHHDRI